MRRLKTVLISTMILMFCAGAVLDRIWARMPVDHFGPPGHGPPWMGQLNLTSDQQQDIQQIWKDTRQKIGNTFDRRHVLDKQRDQDVLEFLNQLSPAQRAAFEKIQGDYHAQRAALDQERQKIIDDANARSRSLLSDEQKEKWDTLTKQMHDHDHHGPPFGPDTQRSTDSTKTSTESMKSTTRPSDGGDVNHA
jgi:hypothetical protein